MAENLARENRIITCGEMLIIWKEENTEFQPLKKILPTTSNCSFQSASWNSIGNEFASLPFDGKSLFLCAVDFADIVNYHEIPFKQDRISSLCYLKQSKEMIGLGTSSGDILLWDTKQHITFDTIKAHSSEITTMDFSSTDILIASGALNGEIRLSRRGTACNEHNSSLQTDDDAQSLRAVKFSPHHRSTLASTGDDGTVCLWNINSNQLTQKYEESHMAPALDLCFSSNYDRMLISGGLDKRIGVYDLMSKGSIKYLQCDEPVYSLSVLKDGKTILAGTSRGKIYIYDLRKSTVAISHFQAHNSKVFCVRANGNVQQKTSRTKSHNTEKDAKPRLRVSKSVSNLPNSKLKILKTAETTKIKETKSLLTINQPIFNIINSKVDKVPKESTFNEEILNEKDINDSASTSSTLSEGSNSNQSEDTKASLKSVHPTFDNQTEGASNKCVCGGRVNFQALLDKQLEDIKGMFSEFKFSLQSKQTQLYLQSIQMNLDLQAEVLALREETKLTQDFIEEYLYLKNENCRLKSTY